MRIAVSASTPSLDSRVDARFGRCAYFVVVDPATMAFEVVGNPSGASAQGAGIASAQMIAGTEVDAVLTGNCGPKAYEALSTAGIKVITAVSGTVREAVRRFTEGCYQASDAPNVNSHHGMAPPGAARRGMGDGVSSVRQAPSAADSESPLVGVLKELQEQLQSLRNQVDDINQRIDELHKDK